MKKAFLRIISQYNFDQKEGTFIETYVWRDIYTYSMLKSKYIQKSKIAASVHNINLRDEILLFIQNGLTEKDSLIITEDYISIIESSLFKKNSLDKIEWKQIERIQLLNHTLIVDLKTGESKNYDMNNVFPKNKEKSDIFIELLQRLLKAANGAKESYFSNNKVESLINKKMIVSFVIAAILISGIFGFFKAPLLNLIETNSKKNDNPKEIILPSAELSKYDTIWSEKQQKDYIKYKQYELINVFNEPYEVTMEAHKFAGLFNIGGDRIIIPIEIPKNTKNWVYRMRLTNARIDSGDSAKLINDLKYVVKTINPGLDISTQILNKITSPTKEKPFTNAYFIDNKKDAKKFQEGKSFEYDINSSIKNTHSRNGLIKFNKNQFVYLGLENEGFDDNIYVTLEVVALIEHTKYFKLIEK